MKKKLIFTILILSCFLLIGCETNSFKRFRCKDTKDSGMTSMRFLREKNDNNNVQLRESELCIAKNLFPETIDFRNFKMTGFGIGKDKKYVYDLSNGEKISIISGADPETFKSIDWGFAKDRNFVYGHVLPYNYSGYGIIQIYHDMRTALGPMILFTNSDAQNFKGLKDDFLGKRSTTFWTDKKFIYTRYSDRGFQLDYVDVQSFSIIDQLYAIDKDHVFCIKNMRFPIIIPGADAETFESMQKGYYRKDKNRVYRRCDIVEGVDPDTFVIY